MALEQFLVGSGRERAGLSGGSVPRGLPRVIGVTVTALSAVFFYAFLTRGTFNPLYQSTASGWADQFFPAQATTMLHGTFVVAPGQVPGECWIHDGRCYGYFGVTPSILRMPLLPYLNSKAQSLTAVYMTVATTLAVGMTMALMHHLLAEVRRTRRMIVLGWLLAICVGPATVVMQSMRPAMYEEAIEWSVGFGMLAIYAFVRWWETRRARWAVALVVSLLGGANARPTICALSLVMGVGIAAAALWRKYVGRSPSQRQYLRHDMLFGALLPIATVGTACGVYWLKFRTLVPSPILNQQQGGPMEVPVWRAIRMIDGTHLGGLRFLPTDLLAYLRPDGVNLITSFPFVTANLGPSPYGVHYLFLPHGAIFAEHYTTFPDTMPLAFASMAIALVWASRRVVRSGGMSWDVVGRLVESPMTWCVLGGAAMLFVTVTLVGLTSRYLTDGLPFFVTGTLVSARALYPSIERLSRVRAGIVIAIVAIVTIWSIFVTVGVEYSYWWNGIS